MNSSPGIDVPLSTSLPQNAQRETSSDQQHSSRESLQQHYARYTLPLQQEYEHFLKRLALLQEELDETRKVLPPGSEEVIAAHQRYAHGAAEGHQQWETFWREYSTTLPLREDLQTRVEAQLEVGRSVLAKMGVSLGENNDASTQLGIFLSPVDRRNKWLQHPPSVVALTYRGNSPHAWWSPELPRECYVVLREEWVTTSAGETKHHDQEYMVPLSWFFMSDREYAKLVRAFQREAQELVDSINYGNRKFLQGQLEFLENALRGSLRRHEQNHAALGENSTR